MNNLCHPIVLVLCGILITTSRANHVITSGSTDVSSQPKTCQLFPTQNSLNIHEMLGNWNGTEIITHTSSLPGTYYYDVCVLVQLADITEYMTVTTERSSYGSQRNQHRERSMRYLRLLWDEGDRNLEYTLKYSEENPGVWQNVGEQTGSMLNFPYRQFNGNIQVAKAVNDHMVLTFCDTNVNNTFFTVVLTRSEQGLGNDVLRSIRSLLARRGLATEAVRKLCASSATILMSSVTISLLLSFLVFLRSH